jgi:hypothetical protein
MGMDDLVGAIRFDAAGADAWRALADGRRAPAAGKVVEVLANRRR